jgi:hypothetical protein
MARYKRVQVAGNKATRPMTPSQYCYLTIGHCPGAFRSEDSARRAWATHREALLAEAIRRRGPMPWAWWVFEVGESPPEAPDPRMDLTPWSAWDAEKARCAELGIAFPGGA